MEQPYPRRRAADLMQHGGQETKLFSIITNLLHFGMTIVGLDYGYAGQTGVDEVRGGAPYGATTIADGDGSRQPSEAELNGARYQGRRVAEVAAKLADRKSVVEGKRGAVRVVPGGRRILKKKKKQQ